MALIKTRKLKKSKDSGVDKPDKSLKIKSPTSISEPAITTKVESKRSPCEPVAKKSRKNVCDPVAQKSRKRQKVSAPIPDVAHQNVEEDKSYNAPKRKKKKAVDDATTKSIPSPDEEVESEDEKVSKREANDETTTSKKKITSYDQKMTDHERKRTIFVGNLPIGVTRKDIGKLFSKYGPVDSVRIRSIIPGKEKLSKKVAAIKNEISSRSRDNVNGYVMFKESSSVEKALEMNNHLFNERRLQVDSLDKSSKYDHKRSVFVGNLTFKCSEDDLFAHFADCGDIERVRIVRDRTTGLGKGFGFVVFKEESAAGLGLKLNGETFQNKPLRVTRVVKKFGKKKRDAFAASKKKRNSHGLRAEVDNNAKKSKKSKRNSSIKSKSVMV